MDRDYDKEIIEDDVTRMVRQAFGVDEDQLLRDFLLAQTEIKDDQIPPEPGEGFEQLLKKMKDRGIRPKYIHADSNIIRISAEETAVKDMTDGLNGSGTAGAEGAVLDSGGSYGDAAACNNDGVETRKPRRLRTIMKVAAIAAVLMAMVFGMGITARARKRYTYVITEKNNGIDILYEKGSTIGQVDLLEDAYDAIQKEIGIQPLKLSYIPNDMFFKKITIDKSRAKIWFEYNGKMIYVTQQLRLEGSSFLPISDRKPYMEIYNQFLDYDIPIEMNVLEDGEKEFHMRMTRQDSIYSIEGIVEEKEFKQIIENIYFDGDVR